MVGANCFYTGNLIDPLHARRSLHTELPGHWPPRLRRLWPDGYRPRHVRRALLYRHQLPYSRGRQFDKLLPGTVVEILWYQVYGKQLFVLMAVTVILSTTWLKNLSRLPTTLSLYFVCFIGHSRPLNYTVIAVLGYLSYGEDVQAQVTLNLPSGKLYTRITILMTLITLLAKYALVIQLIATVIKEKLSLTTAAATDAENNGQTRVLTSTAVVISMVVLVCMVPFFGYLMSFVRSSLNVTVAMLFPCLSYLKIYMP
uniref:Amino acid transporter transmembrane domain-containing protein n=1 Tax=Oryza meridionalis TaxID=40149 RepID=A0A0E0C3X7_9ORYZ